jgi:hypothetical protein
MREAVGGETRLDVVGVEFDDAGALLTVEVGTDALLGCPEEATVIVRSQGGEELTRRAVPLETDYPFFGLVSIEAQCAGRGQVRIPGFGPDGRVSFDVAFSGDVAASGGLHRLGDLADAPAPTPDPGPGNPIEGAVSSTVQPILRGGALLGGLYLAWDNIGAISDLLSSSNE